MIGTGAGGPLQPPIPQEGRNGFRIVAGVATTRTITPGNTTTGSVTGLLPGNTYRARVRAFDAAGNYGPWSDELVVVTASDPAPPTVMGVTTIGVSSPPVPAATPATVAGTAAVATPGAGFVRTFTPTGTTQSVTGLLASRQYRAQVRAHDAAGNWGPFSTVYTFTTTGSGNVSPATVNATAAVAAPNVGGTPPTLVAGTARPVVVGSTVALNVGATPPGGESIIAYQWSIVSGAGSLTNATTATPTYTPPGSGSGLVTVRAAVSATNAGRATADMIVSYGPTVVAAENALTGTARATWDLTSPNLGGVSTLQGFADGFSTDRTGTVSFKIAQSDTAGWTADVYRLGYYSGNGARLYANLTPSGGQVSASQAQPAPADADPDTTLLSASCAAWSTTLTWSPPAWAPSGMYVLRLNRTGGGASHILFVVRDDARRAALVVMPSDSTWNAYNAWGGMGASMYTGNSLYFGTAVDQYNADCAHYVSYDRPVVNRGAADSGRTYGAVAWSTFFTGEYPMVRFLERNGIDTKYYGCIDAAGDPTGTHLRGNGTTRAGAGAAMMIGHNEYWSDGQRAGWEAARDNGVNLFSCASNEVFWRTVGTVTDSESRPRVYECQKSTINGRGSTRPQWTGTWRDPDGAGKGGGFPENALTGTIFAVNGPDLRALVVPFAGGYSATPLWRDTAVAALTTGQSYTSPAQIIGFEWDTYGSAGTNGAGATFMGTPNPRTIFCSDVTYAVSSLMLIDAGDVYGAGNATHRLAVFPGPHGGMVFGTGTINWALGCDNANTYQQGADNTATAIQQATLNMLTDMGAPPTTIMSGLVQPTLYDWYIDAQGATVQAVTAITTPMVATTANTTATPAVVAGTTQVGAAILHTGVTPAPAAVTGATTITAPAILLSALPAPTVVAGSTTIGAPVTTGRVTTTPAVVAGTTAVATPAITTGTAPTPAVVSGVTAVGAPAVSTGTLLAPAAVNAVTAIAAPAIQTASGSTAVPATVAATTTTAATAGAGTVVAPAVVAAVTTIGAPTIRLSSLPTPATTAGATTVGAPALTTGAAVTPAAVNATTTVPAVTVVTGNAPQPATVAATTAVGAPTVTAGGTTNPTTVTATTAVGGAANTGTTVTPPTVAAPAAVATPTVTAANIPAPATTAAVTTIGAPSVGGSANPAPTTVGATTGVGAVVVRQSAAITPGTIGGLAAIAAAQAITSLTVAATTVGATTTVGGTASARATPLAVTVNGVNTVPAPTVRSGALPAPGTVLSITIVGGARYSAGTITTSTGTGTVTGVSLTAQVTGENLPGKVIT